MPQHDLADLHRRLTMTSNAMTVVAVAMISIYLGLWIGITPEDACLPIGIAALVATLGAVIHAARTIGGRAETGPLAQWNRSIRMMSIVNGVVALMMLAYPAVA